MSRIAADKPTPPIAAPRARPLCHRQAAASGGALGRLRRPLGHRRRVSLPLDGLGVVQGRGRLLLALGLDERDHRHARRCARPAAPSPLDGYHGAWMRAGVLALGASTPASSTLLRRRDLADLRHARRLRAGALGLPLYLLDPDRGADLPRHAARHAGLGLSAAVLPAGASGATCRPTIIVLVAINQPFTLWMLHSLLPVDPQGSGRKRDGRRLHPVPGVPARRSSR